MKNPMRRRQKKNKVPKRKNMIVLSKLNVKENVDITSTPHEEEYDEQNYKSVEEWETAL